MTLSPASVRSVMQDLEELGLIFAPHTSAGRLPTQSGLRFFVDALLEIGDLSDAERQRIEAEVKAASQSRTLERRPCRGHQPAGPASPAAPASS